ncbi:MAG: purine-nucleoside phosphorylase [Bacilli bacterium]|nr:purine-nucleoside phosphorylase [Bacilli bacterium]
MPTPHIEAQIGDFAPVVLMPGDPKRADWIAHTFLHDVKQVTAVRGMLGFTGLTKNGIRVSVMASGMGLPSIGIYSYELFSHYGVEAIIRVGTCGAYQKDVKLRDIIIGQAACTNSGWLHDYDLQGGIYSAISDFELIEHAVEASRKLGKEPHVGNILSSDTFYCVSADLWKKWADLGVKAVEMEAFALYTNAARFNKKALAICTVSDSFVAEGILSSTERQDGLIDMVNIGIATAEAYMNKWHKQ